MAKGVKKIKYVGGKIYKYLCIPNVSLAIPPEEEITLQVGEWFPGTTEVDKKKELIWMQLTQDRKYIIKQISRKTEYKFKIEKKYCGVTMYYLEASLSGKSDDKNFAGLYIQGVAPPLIVSSRWSIQKGGASIKNNKKTNWISYGSNVYLNLTTEGLNGKNLIIDIFNRQHFRNDKLIFTYPDVKVVDGEVNLKIQNTFSWMSEVSNIQDIEEFYIKVKDPSTGKYIKDSRGDELHAIYLNIKEKVVTTQVVESENLTPTTVYKPDVNAERYEPCKFTEIKITEVEKKDGKVKPNSVTVFKDGQKLANTTTPKAHIERKILFEFDSANLSAEGAGVLNKILKFLLANPHSTINLSGHACVIGKMEYNKELSQRRAETVKKFLADGKLDPKRIIAVGKGEINSTDDKKGRDNIKYKNEKEYIEARCVYLSFDFYGHDAQTVVYETIAPSVDFKKELTFDILGFETKACFRDKNKHENKITILDVGQVMDNGSVPKPFNPPSFNYNVYSDLSQFNLFPIQYIWPIVTTPNKIYLHVHSCRYYSNKQNSTVLIKVYPDIKWTLEFKWCHKYPFTYTYGNELHPYDIKKGREKVIGSEIDRALSEKEGEMGQFFNLSLKAEWNRSTTQPQNVEFGGKFGERIAKTLSVFNKIKRMTEKIANSPLAKGKIMFEIKSPVIAFSAQWYLQRAKSELPEVATIITIGIEATPLVEAEFTINLYKLFTETAGNAICPGAGSIINWVLDKLESNVGIEFLVVFSGGIYVGGQVTINTSYPKETQGEVKARGKVKVVVKFRAWAGAEIGYLGVDGVVKADVSTSVTGGVKIGADKDGIYASPIAEFDGIKATFVAVGTVKFGIFKRTFTYKGEAILVEPDKIEFNKYYM